MSLEDFGMVRLISGAQVEKEKGIAFCHCDTHRGYLSKSLISSHNCIQKQCPFFNKINKKYWKNIENKKDCNRKKRKDGLKEKKIAKQLLDERNSKIKEILERHKSLKVTAILDENNKPLRICFTSNNYVDFNRDMSKIREIAGKSVYFKRINHRKY